MNGRLSRNSLMILIAVSGMVFASQRLEAQVGLSSGMAQVALVARVAPRGSIQGVSGQRENSRVGAVREVSVTVRMSANTGYQLLVHRAGGAGRIWVRTVRGDFQELTASAPVTVASDRNSAGQWEREVQYRVEPGEASGLSEILPVRYEIAISPTM